MKTLDQLIKQSEIGYDYSIGAYTAYKEHLQTLCMLVAKEVAQNIADEIRLKYDNVNAEMLAFNIEMLYNIHGDYGDK